MNFNSIRFGLAYHDLHIVVVVVVVVFLILFNFFSTVLNILIQRFVTALFNWQNKEAWLQPNQIRSAERANRSTTSLASLPRVKLVMISPIISLSKSDLNTCSFLSFITHHGNNQTVVFSAIFLFFFHGINPK